MNLNYFRAILVFSSVVFAIGLSGHRSWAQESTQAETDQQAPTQEVVAKPAKEPAKELELDESLAAFKPYIGNWEVNSNWAGGEKLWARSEYRVGVGGKFVEARTFAKDGDGEIYCRYLTIFAWDKKQSKIVSHGFTFDGSTTFGLTMEQSKSEDGRPQLTSVWKPDPTKEQEVKQTITLADDSSYLWQVWSKPTQAGEYDQIMDAVWEKRE